MKKQRDQIIHPMKNIPDEHEDIQNPVAGEFHKENSKDCLSLGSMIQERMKEQTSAQEVLIEVKRINLQKVQDTPILDSGAVVDDPNLKVMDSQMQIEESNYKVQDIPVIHVTTKENDPIFQISAVGDPQEAQDIHKLNRDPEAKDYQEYISEECLNRKSKIHEETKKSSLEDFVELSLNVNPKKDSSPQE
ncbi:hypothetical protein AMTRI_Chr11g154490 [Amborella trichopoda]